MKVTVEQLAKICHETNRIYCEAIGDHTQMAWEQAAQWQRDSAINGVKFHMAVPDATPMMSHNSWLEQKRKEGWGWGPAKDVVNKLHPCFRPYQELPQEQQVKDHLFKGMCDLFRSHVIDFNAV